MKMPFGKYKGEHIEDIPTNYLKWLEEQPNIDSELRRHLNHEIERREGNRSSKGFVKHPLESK